MLKLLLQKRMFHFKQHKHLAITIKSHFLAVNLLLLLQCSPDTVKLFGAQIKTFSFSHDPVNSTLI